MVVMPWDRISKGVSRFALVLASTCVLAVAMTACSPAAEESAPTPSPSSAPAVNATEATLLPTEVAALPDVTPESYDALLTQLRGTPVVVNLWGSWCPPCREEAPHLAEAAHRYGDRVQFIGIDFMDTKEAGRRFIDEFDWPFPSLFDPSPTAALRNHLGYIGQPDTVFYDAAGEKVGQWEGAISPEELDRQIQALLVDVPAAPPSSPTTSGGA